MGIGRLDLQAETGAGAVTDMQRLRELKAQATQDAPGALEAVAQQFEALFIGMLLDSMRAATIEGGLDGSGETELYQQLFDRQVATNIAAGGGLGIARLLVEQLSRDLPEVAAGEPGPPAAGAPAAGAGRAHGGPDAVEVSPGRFIREVLPHARRAAEELGVDPMALLAQAALETGWGGRLPRRADGRSSLNVFGVKAGDSWRGERAVAGTLEFAQGVAVRRRDQFRAYGSLGEAFADYVRLLGSSPRYAEARAAGGDPQRYAQALQEAGYATDPRYAAKIRAILESPQMNEARVLLKAGGEGPIT